MSISTLTNTTWQFNSTLTFPSAEDSFTLNFTSNGSTYSSFEWNYGELYYGSTTVYDTSFGGRWSQNYRLVTVTGGTDATNATLISFFTNNATLMGNEYIAMDWELTDIADAIRSKRGISTSLSYPSGFVSNINSINHQKLTHDDVEVYMGDDVTLDPSMYGDYDGFDYVDVTVAITPYDGSVTVTGGAITDLTGTTWLMNSVVDAMSLGTNYTPIEFTSNNITYVYLYFNDMRLTINYGETRVYDLDINAWRDEAYRTVTFTGGGDPTDATFIAWLQDNATQIS